MLKFHLVCYPETFMVGRAAQEKICILEKVAYMRSPGLKGSTVIIAGGGVRTPVRTRRFPARPEVIYCLSD